MALLLATVHLPLRRREVTIPVGGATGVRYFDVWPLQHMPMSRHPALLGERQNPVYTTKKMSPYRRNPTWDKSDY
ncbi:MAG TPA: hypothetical protein PLY87_29190, partial [Planctomycetaceae bacterium]|nr:hypothetical protein [Planctomycetaceae bacterium]